MAALNTAEPDLRTYLQILRRRYYWVIAAVVLLGAAAGGYSVNQPKQYTASAQLLVQPTTGTLPSAGSQQVISPTDVLTELQLLTAAPVKEAVRQQLGSEPNVSASEVGQTDVIAVAATSKSPTLAAKIANAYANAFVAYQQTVTNAQVASLSKSVSTSPQVDALLVQETTLKEELATLQVSGAVSGGGVEVVTPAKAPTSPSSPKPVQDTLIAVIVGLLLGIGIAFLIEHLDDAVYSKEEAGRLAGDAPVLGMIPRIGSWKRRGDVVLASTASPTSSVAEAYRSLRTSLQFAGHDGNMTTILVTSPSPGEGKTATIANLGVVLAQADQRVVVVSCDLRRPRLGQFFERSESPGFTSVILGQTSLGDALQTVEGLGNLFFLGSGDVPPNPTELDRKST